VDDDRGMPPKQNPAFRYVPIGITDRDFAPDWVKMQGRKFNSLIREIRNTADLNEFSKVGYQLFHREMKKYNKLQQNYIWTQYYIQKLILYRKIKHDFMRLLAWVNTYQCRMGDMSRIVTRIKLEKRLILSNEMWTVIYAVISKRAGQVWFDRFLKRVRKYRKGGEQS